MLETELTQAKRIAQEAGRRIMELYDGDIAVEMKGQSDPVTEADKRANAYIVAELSEHFPSDGVVAEENVDHGDSLQKSRIWYVDPLDGTKEFIAKNGEFAVMLGLSIDGRSQLGVVYQPVTKKLYAGVVRVGATLQIGDDERPLEVSRKAEASERQLVVSRSHRSQATDRFVKTLGIQHEVRSGSVGLKIGMIAEQRADLYVHLSDRSSAWDACGPEAIVVAAGGAFTDLAGNPFRYGSKVMANQGGILASNGTAHAAAAPVAKQIGSELGLV